MTEKNSQMAKTSFHIFFKIHALCKSSEPEIVLAVLQIKTNFMFVNLTKRVNNCHIALEILQKIWMSRISLTVNKIFLVNSWQKKIAKMGKKRELKQFW